MSIRYLVGSLIKKLIWAVIIAFIALPRPTFAELDLNNPEDVVQIIAAILKRHPNFVSLNNAYRRNLFELYRQAAKVQRDLGNDGAPATFVATDFLSGQYTTEMVRYDEKALKEVRDGLVRDLNELELPKIAGVKADIEAIKEASKKDGQLDNKIFKKRLSSYVRLMPFLYGGNLKPISENIEQTKKTVRTQIETASAAELDNRYKDQFTQHQAKPLKELSKEKGLGMLDEAVQSQFNQYIQKTLTKALMPIANSGGATTLRTLSIERVPPLAAIIRGTFGGDCSMATVPHYPLIKGTWVYWIRKNGDLNSQPQGYALVTTIEVDGQKLPYIITINGSSLAEEDSRAVKHLVAKDFGVKKVLTHDFENGSSNIVNSDSMRRGLKPSKGKRMTVQMPAGWEKVDRHSSSYYNADKLKLAVLEDLKESSIHFDEIKVTHLDTPYPKPKKMSEMSTFERALIGSQAMEESNAHELASIKKALGVTERELQLAEQFTNRNHEKPIDAELYEEVRKQFNLPYDYLLSTDYFSASHSLGLIVKQNPKLIPTKDAEEMSATLLKTINRELSGLLREAPNLGEREVKIAFQALVDALKALKPIASPQNDELKLSFIDRLFGDAVGDKAIEKIGIDIVRKAIAEIVPKDASYLKEKAIEALSSRHAEPKKLAVAVLAHSEKLDPKDLQFLISKLTDPDAEKSVQEVLENKSHLQLVDSKILLALVNDPDVAVYTLQKLIPKLKGKIPSEMGEDIYSLILKRDLAEKGIPAATLKSLGPLPKDASATVLEKLNGWHSSKVLPLLLTDTSLFSKIDSKEEKRLQIVNQVISMIGQEDSGSIEFLNALRAKLKESEFASVYHSILRETYDEIKNFHQYYDNQKKEKEKRISELVHLTLLYSKDSRAKNALLNYYSDIPLEFVMGVTQITLDWKEWSELYKNLPKRKANETNWREQRMWQLSRFIKKPMPVDVENLFFDWLYKKEKNNSPQYRFHELIQDKDIPDQAYTSHAKLFTTATKPTNSFYERLFEALKKEDLDAKDVAKFFTDNPNKKFFLEFAKIISKGNKRDYENMIAQGRYLPTEKEIELINRAIAEHLADYNSGSLDFLQLHLPRTLTPQMQSLILEAYPKAHNYTQKGIVEMFEKRKIDFNKALREHKKISPLEIAKLWYKDDLKPDSKWIELAATYGHTPPELMTALRNDKEFQKEIVEKHTYSKDPYLSVFDGQVISDPEIRNKVLEFACNNSGSPSAWRIFQANRDLLSKEQYLKTSHALLKTYTSTVRGSYTPGSENPTEENNLSILLKIMTEHLSNPKFQSSKLELLLQNSPMEVTSKIIEKNPLTWQEWEKGYKAIPPNTENHNYDSMKRQYWKLMQILPPMPQSIETQFWKWLKDGKEWESKYNFKEIINSDTREFSNNPGVMTPWTIQSESFYEKLFKLAKAKKIESDILLYYFSKAPHRKYFKEAISLIFSETNHSGGYSRMAIEHLIKLDPLKLTLEERSHILIKMLEFYQQKRENSDWVSLACKLAEKTWTEETKNALLNCYVKEKYSHVRDYITNVFKDKNLDVNTEVSAKTKFSALELGQKWFYENAKHDSIWLQHAARQQMTPEDLIVALRKDKAGYLKLLELGREQKKDLIFEVFKGVTIEDPEVRKKLIDRGTNHTGDSKFLDVLKHNGAMFSAEELKTIFEKLFYDIDKCIKHRKSYYNYIGNIREEDLAEALNTIRQLATLPAGREAALSIIEGSRIVPELILKTTQIKPFTWPDWEKKYNALKKRENYDINYEKAHLWRLGLLIQEPMPQHLENKFWDWLVEDNTKEKNWKPSLERFKKVIGKDHFSEGMSTEDVLVAPDLYQHLSPLSNKFYDRLFNESKKDNIESEAAIEFFIRAPSESHFNLFLEEIEKTDSSRAPHLLEKYLESPSLNDIQKQKIVAALGKALIKAKQHSHNIQETLDKTAGAHGSPALTQSLLEAYEHGEKNNRSNIKKLLNALGVQDIAAACAAHLAEIAKKNGN